MTRNWNEEILEAVAEERQRLANRRRFLGRGAKLAGAGAVAVALAAVPGTRAFRVSAQDFTDDVDILNFALTLERLEATFYVRALDEFDEDDFAELDVRSFFGNGDDEGGDESDGEEGENDDLQAQVGASIFARIGEIRDHEQAHVDAITQTITDLGGQPVDEDEYDFGDAFESVGNFLEIAVAFENTGVAAYAGAAPFIQAEEVVVAALSIHSVEARHAAYLNFLFGESPFPDAFDEAQTREEVLAAVDPFIVDDEFDDDDAADVTATTEETAVADDGADVTATVTDDGGDDDDDADVTATVEDGDVEATTEPTVEATVEATVEPTVEATETP